MDMDDLNDGGEEGGRIDQGAWKLGQRDYNVEQAN